MNDDVKHQFIRAALLFKKVDIGELAGGIPYGEMVVMARVQALQPQSCLNAAELADRLCVSRPAVSQMLRSLEGKGYIVRQPNPADRRRITVVSTNEGSLALRQAQRRYNTAVNHVLGAMTPEELTTLIHLMNRLTSVYNELKNKPPEEGDTP